VLVIAADLMPHTVLWQTPTMTQDELGNDLPSWSAGVSIPAWVQQFSTSEDGSGSSGQVSGVGSNQMVSWVWLMIANQDGIGAGDRITWLSTVFEVDGLPAPVFTPAGFHHAEIKLKAVTG